MTLFLPLYRADVLAALGTAWPAPVGSTILRLGPDTVTDGAVVVYAVEGQPGTTWWAVDGVVPSQSAGLVTDALAALVPGVVEIVPDPWSDTTPPASYSSDPPVT